MPFFQCAFLQSFSTFLAFFARMGKRLKQRDKILGIFLLLNNCPFFSLFTSDKRSEVPDLLVLSRESTSTAEESRDQFWCLGNCPPTPPQTQHFAPSKK